MVDGIKNHWKIHKKLNPDWKWSRQCPSTIPSITLPMKGILAIGLQLFRLPVAKPGCFRMGRIIVSLTRDGKRPSLSEIYNQNINGPLQRDIIGSFLKPSRVKIKQGGSWPAVRQCPIDSLQCYQPKPKQSSRGRCVGGLHRIEQTGSGGKIQSNGFHFQFKMSSKLLVGEIIRTRLGLTRVNEVMHRSKKFYKWLFHVWMA